MNGISLQIYESDEQIIFSLPSVNKLKKIKTDSSPKKSGVYFIFNSKDELIYIGESENIYNRMKYHLRPKTKGPQVPSNEVDKISYYLVDKEGNLKNMFMLHFIEYIYIYKAL